MAKAGAVAAGAEACDRTTWKGPSHGHQRDIVDFAYRRPVAGSARVSANVKMSGIAGMALTHRTARASFTKSSWRCSTHFAEGGTSERDLREERGGPFHPGDRRGPGECQERGPPVPELSGSHEAEAKATAEFQAGPLHRVRRPAPRRRVGELRGAAPGTEEPGVRRRLLHPEVLRVAQATSSAAGSYDAVRDCPWGTGPGGLGLAGLPRRSWEEAPHLGIRDDRGLVPGLLRGTGTAGGHRRLHPMPRQRLRVPGRRAPGAASTTTPR